MHGYQCLKNIYQIIHNPELASPITEEQQAIFDQGNKIGEKARKSFPGGVLVDNKPWDFFGSLKKTRDLIKNEKIIYEAAFEYNGCYARADIIVFSNETKSWSIYEVKSSTKVKPEQLDDVGLQTWIIANSGLPIEATYILHLNPDCHFPNLDNLFIKENVTDSLKNIHSNIDSKLKKIFRVINSEKTPDIDIGPHCFSPWECGFRNSCWREKNIPKISIFDLPRIDDDKKWEFYKNDIIHLNDKRLSGLSELQLRMKDAFISEKRFIDKDLISNEMKTWKYPLVFLDFETINPAIPRYEGCSPYKQVPFQFSIHIQREPEGELEHHEYLHEDNSDPRPHLIPELLEACSGSGSIVAYYASFEKNRIKEMADQFSDYSDKLNGLLDRFVDPLPIIREGVYDNNFRGSFSLKNVAPAILGDNYSYQDMVIPDGNATQRAFEELIARETKTDRKRELREAMLDYCKKDTFVMVKLIHWLLDQANSKS